jgi:Zn-finger nucleic acid-binding protein
MRTHNRNGIHIEQCDSCRGVFLDFGELEAISRLETQWAAPMPQHGPPPGYGGPPPGWGSPHYHPKHKYKSFGRMFFSS